MLTHLCLALLPAFPVLPQAERKRMAADAAAFVRTQLAGQPLWLKLPLQLSGMVLGMGAAVGFLPLWLGRLPVLGLALRFYRSMATVVFYDDDATRQLLGLPATATHVQDMRARRAAKVVITA